MDVVNIAQQTTNQTPNPPASQADRTKKRRRRTVLKRIVDAPLQDTGGRLFDPENAILHEQRDALLMSHYGALRDATFDAYPQLGWNDAESILARLSRRLHQFANVPTDAGFLEWASCYVGIQARRQKNFDALLTDENNLAYARKGIWSILQSCSDLGPDSGVTEELELEVLKWLWANLTKLNSDYRTAKVSTILYSVGRNQARTWKTVRLREKKAYADLDYVDRIAENYQPGKLGEGRQIHFPEPQENKYIQNTLN